MAEFDDGYFPTLSEGELERAARSGVNLKDFLVTDPVTREGYREATPEDDQTRWSDYGKALGIGSTGVASSAVAGTEYATRSDLGDDTRQYLNDSSDDQMAGTTNRFRRNAAAAFFPGEGEESVWDVGLGNAIAAKTALAAPSLAASVITAGMVAAAASGLGLPAAGVGLLAAGAARGTSGLLTAGEVANQIYSDIDKRSNDELMRLSDVYAGYISMGMTEHDARAKFRQDVAGAMPLAVGALSALLGGVEGKVGHLMGEEAGEGLVRGVLTGFGKEAVQEMGESGGGELAAQAAGAMAGLSDMDWLKVLSQTAEGGVVGGVLGGGVGGIAGLKGNKHGATVLPDPLRPDPAQAAALAAGGPPPPPDPAAAAGSAPAGGPPAAGAAGASAGPPPPPRENLPTPTGEEFDDEEDDTRVVGRPPAPPTAAPTATVSTSAMPADVEEQHRAQNESMAAGINQTADQEIAVNQAKVDALVSGQVPAVSFPSGTKPGVVPPLPPGMKRAGLKGRTVYYNPNQISWGEMNAVNEKPPEFDSLVGTKRENRAPTVKAPSQAKAAATAAAASPSVYVRPSAPVQTATEAAPVAAPAAPVEAGPPETGPPQAGVAAEPATSAVIEPPPATAEQPAGMAPTPPATVEEEVRRPVISDEEKARYVEASNKAAAAVQTDAVVKPTPEKPEPVAKPAKPPKVAKAVATGKKKAATKAAPATALAKGATRLVTGPDNVLGTVSHDTTDWDTPFHVKVSKDNIFPLQKRFKTEAEADGYIAKVFAKDGGEAHSDESLFIRRVNEAVPATAPVTEAPAPAEKKPRAPRKPKTPKVEAAVAVQEQPKAAVTGKEENAPRNNMQIVMDGERFTVARMPGDPNIQLVRRNNKALNIPAADFKDLTWTEYKSTETAAPAAPKPVPIAPAVAAAKAAVEAKAAEKPKTGRLLTSTTAETEAAIKKANDEIAARASKVANVTEDDEPTVKVSKGKNRTVEEKNKRKSLNEAAITIAANPDFAPKKVEKDYATSTVAKNAMLARAKAMVAAAEKAGYEWLGKASNNKDPDMNLNSAAVLLLEAKAFVEAKKRGDEHYNRFYTREMLARANKIEELLSDRRVAGAEAVRAASTVGAVSNDGPSQADTLSDAEQVANYDSIEDDPDLQERIDEAKATKTTAKVLTADEILAEDAAKRNAERLREQTGAKPVPKKLQEKIDKARAVAARPGTEGEGVAADNAVMRLEEQVPKSKVGEQAAAPEGSYTHGVSKEGQVKVETNPMAANRPKVTGKVSLGARKTLPSTPPPADTSRPVESSSKAKPKKYSSTVDPITELESNFELESIFNDAIDDVLDFSVDSMQPGPVQARHDKAWEKDEIDRRSRDMGNGVWHVIAPVDDATGTGGWTWAGAFGAKRTLGELVGSQFFFNGMVGFERIFARFMQRKFLNKLKDIPVIIVSYDDMERLRWAPNKQGYTLGYYDDAAGHIVMSERAFTNGQFQHTMVHEALHAAFFRTLEHDKGLRNIANDMMLAVRSAYGKDWRDIYGLTNAHEFMSEAFTNPEFQNLLASMPAGRFAGYMAKIPGNTMWDAFVSFVRKVLGVPRHFTSMLEASMKLGQELETARPKYKDMPVKKTQVSPHSILEQRSTDITASVKSNVEGAFRTLQSGNVNVTDKLRKGVLSMMSNDQLRQAAENSHSEFGEHYFKVVDAIERMGPKGRKYAEEGHELAERLRQLSKKDAEAARAFGEFTHAATVSRSHPDLDIKDAANKHMFTAKGKLRRKYIQPAKMHAALRADYRALPLAYKELYADMKKYFQTTQDALTRANIKGVMEAAEGTVTPPPGETLQTMANWVFDGGLAKPADDAGNKIMRDALGKKLVNHLTNVMGLKRIEGAYFPMMRRGDFVLTAREKVDPMGGRYDAEKGEILFDTEEQANKFAETTTVTVFDSRKVATDENGSRVVTDEDGEPARLVLADANVEEKYLVKIQNKHVEFFETPADAYAAEKRMRASGEFDNGTISGVQNRQDTNVNLQMLPRQVEILINSIRQRDSLDPAQRKVLEDSIIQSAVSMLGGSRIQHRRMPRRYVAGASKDLLRNTIDYATASGNYRAKQDLGKEVNDGMAALRKVRGQLAYAESSNAMVRDDLFRELESRVTASNTPESAGTISKGVRILLALSFLDKLASPAYSLINAMQPWLVTMPVLAAKYGWVEASKAMTRAYADVGGIGTVTTGLRDTAKMFLEDKGTDFLASYKERLAKRYPNEEGQRLVELMDYLGARGAIDVNAGMEIGRFMETTTMAGRGLNRAELIARALPAAVEAINRGTTAIAEYRLAMSKGASHEAAMKSALTQVNNTQGNYSATNAPPVFNHPAARVVLQFKKYGQMVYHLLGQSVYQAFKGETPEIRKQGAKMLLNLAMTHASMAGVMGLPLEPIKLLFLPIAALGGPDWEDIEEMVRRSAANHLGNATAEVITKGLPRALGFDLSNRVGLDSLMTFGGPRDMTEKDVKSWLLDNVLGAPAALLWDWTKAVGAAANGDGAKFLEKAIPIKLVADSIKAYREGTEGMQTKAGRETMAPTGVGAMAYRAFGLTPAGVANKFDKDRVFYDTQKGNSTSRQDLMGGWLNTSKAERGRAWDKIREWNRTQDEDAQITMDDLRKTEKRRKSDTKKGVFKDGYRVGKNDAEAYARTEIYR